MGLCLCCPVVPTLKLTLLRHIHPLRPPPALHVWAVTVPTAEYCHGDSGILCQKKGYHSLRLAGWWVGWIVFLPVFWGVTVLSCD